MRAITSSVPVISRHAQRRMHQRAISKNKVKAALDYGLEYHAGDSVVAFWLNRRAVADAEKRFGVRLDAYTNIAVFIGDDGEIVTTYRVERRQRHWSPGGRRV